MSVDIPRPAGVIAPVRLIPTVTSSSSMCSENSRHPSASRPALYARKALSTSSGTVSRPVMGRGSMRGPRRNSLRVVMAARVSVDGRELPGATLAGLSDDGDRFARGVGRVKQVQVRRRDLAFPGDPIAQRSEEHTSELQSQSNLVCRLLLEKKKNITYNYVLHAHASQSPT